MAINTAAHIHEHIICANILVRKGDKFLVLKRSAQKHYAPGVLALIGGKVDPGENPYQAAQREVLEESGVTVKNMRLEAVIYEKQPVSNEPHDWLVFHFSADYLSGEVITTEEGELLWLTKEELLQATFFPSTQALLPQILEPQTGTTFATMTYSEDKTSIVQVDLNSCAPSPALL